MMSLLGDTSRRFGGVLLLGCLCWHWAMPITASVLSTPTSRTATIRVDREAGAYRWAPRSSDSRELVREPEPQDPAHAPRRIESSKRADVSAALRPDAGHPRLHRAAYAPRRQLHRRLIRTADADQPA